MTDRVLLTRQEAEDRRARQEISSINQDDTVDEEDLEDDEGVQDEREIWEVTHVSKSWKRLRVRVCLDHCLDDCLINCAQHGLCFLINIVEP